VDDQKIKIQFAARKKFFSLLALRPPSLLFSG